MRVWQVPSPKRETGEWWSSWPGVHSPRSKADEAKNSGAAQGRAILHVVPEPFANSARELVAAAVNNARNAKLALEGGAVLLIDTASDPLVEDRARALAAALKGAGIRVAHEIKYASVAADAEKKLGDLLETDRKACIVLGADNTSTKAAFGMTNKMGSERPFVLAGYTADESEVTMTRMGEYAGIAVFSADRLIRKAITTATLAAAGQKFPEPVEMRIPVHISPANSGAPKMNEMMRSKMKSAGE